MIRRDKKQEKRIVDWEKRTRKLCDVGFDANTIISRIYQEQREKSFLDGSLKENADLNCLLAYRLEFWRDEKNLLERAKRWFQSVRGSIDDAVSAGDRLGLFRQLVWLKFSTLPILKELAADVADDGEWAPLVAKFDELLNTASSEFESMPRADSNAIYHQKHIESSEKFFERLGKKIFVNIYRIDRAGDSNSRYVELVETWRWKPEERITLCLPISVGCSNSCRMCDVGTYYGGDLKPDEIARLINMNFEMNNDIPISSEGRNITIYYLGGGDACHSPHLVNVLKRISERYPHIKQVISTIGINDADRMDKLVSGVTAVPNAGFQVSLCSLDNDVRDHILNNNRSALPVEKCIEYMNGFHSLSGRKAYVSLVLVKDLYCDADSIAREANRLLDPGKIHVTLTVMRKSKLPFSHNGASIEKYHELAAKLEAAGFETSMCMNDRDPENGVACGCMEHEILRGNEHFMK